ncbi:MAG: anhydro-N-acetylmuramic acid kinase [Sedimentisphaerales bacterium]|nr:anhydro-N-acetylmuramic acid kinase [Sedimentisphaerales bacterium]
MSNLVMKVGSKSELRVVGLMSGTSADGVDAAIVDIRERRVRVLAFDTYPYRATLQSEILRLCRPESARLDAICHYNHVLGEVFAEAVVRLCNESGISLDSIDLIGSHGQTIYHNPNGGRYAGRFVRSTLQIGEPSVIAQRTGITTVADFRPRDMAAGGEGAPLVPYADYILFSDRRLCRAVQNIGGIANVTFLPSQAGDNQVPCPRSRGHAERANERKACLRERRHGTQGPRDVLAFDTGPGNMVIDGVMRLITKGKRSYDRNGALAARGNVDESLLQEMLRHPFFLRRPPKSTGREQFGQQYCEWLYDRARRKGLMPEDTVATATAFTASTVATAYRRFLPSMPDETILCGGGAHNASLVRMLQAALEGVRIRTTDEFGIDVDAKEAVSFAILAYATIRGVPSNLPCVTGASEPVVLGKIVPGK